MPKRKARADGSVESFLKSARKSLRLSSRYELVLLDRQNGKRKVRKDASVGTLRKKGSKRKAK